MEKHEKVASSHCRGRKNLRVYSWYSLSDLKHDQKHFIRMPSPNVPEMRPLGIFLGQFYQTDTVETMTVEKFDLSFGHVFPRSMTVQRFITIK